MTKPAINRHSIRQTDKSVCLIFTVSNSLPYSFLYKSDILSA